MSRLFVKPVLLATLMFLLFSLTARALGSTQAPNPALTGFHLGCEGQPQPCWYGITPGLTTVDEAAQMLNYQSLEISGRYRSVWTLIYRENSLNCSAQIRHEHSVIHSITISGCSGVLLGDLVIALGTPQGIMPFSLTFMDAKVSAETVYHAAHNDSCLNLTPYGVISNMYIQPQNEMGSRFEPGRWQGFLSYGWYVRRGTALSCAALARLS